MYIYFHCDVWKSTDSMNLVGVFDEPHLKKVVREDLEQNRVVLDGFEPKEESRFTVDELIRNLDYGFIEKIDLNERR